MIVNLPFGGTAEIKDFEDLKYAYGKRYRFRIIDEFGCDISKEQFRDMRLSSVLDEVPHKVLYHMYLTRPNEMDTAAVYLNLGKSELKISGDNIQVRFKCKSLHHAEDIIDTISEPNGYEVAPVNLINFQNSK